MSPLLFPLHRLLLVGLLHCVVAPAGAQTIRPEVEAFVEEMATRHRFDPKALRSVFARVQPRPNIVKAMSAPATARPWHEFREMYVDARRIEGGVRFWNDHAVLLERAAREFGVPAEILVATIGIETRYGRQLGRVKVLEALTTLAFDYPRRAAFFRNELEAFLLLGREQGWDYGEIRGSFAGAMGLPQFLPSSYRQYAVDFDSDGARNLWGQPADAVGSVANYYRAFGWIEGQRVAIPVTLDEKAIAELETGDIQPHRRIADFVAAGAVVPPDVSPDALGTLIKTDTGAGLQYWIALQNFYVITRYNRSVNYAMAVWELAQTIAARRAAGGATG